MEIFSIHNNKLTNKLESMSSTLEAPKIEMAKIIKKDAFTSLLDEPILILTHVNKS
jgi:hypothetical protein